MKNKKVGIIVPHRNRWNHLKEFKKRITEYLKIKKIPYEIIVINQDDARLFNRGALLNIGFKYAEELGCDYVVFHDVDMLPIDVNYSYSNKPLHLATGFKIKDGQKERELFEEYFGGVTLFPMEDFKKIDGYSNKYWGWGYEDTDLLYRCKKGGIKLKKLKIKNTGSDGCNLKFNGINAYVRGRNLFDINYPTTIFISFFPDEIICDHHKDTDDFTLFSIPGYDCSISFNSFLRYNFCTFEKETKKPLYINSKIKTNYKTNICVTIDKENKEIKLYQDGVFVDARNDFDSLHEYFNEEYFYIGSSNPLRKDSPNFFKGHIDSFAIYSSILTPEEIKEMGENKYFGLGQEFGKYKSPHNLKVYYDSKFIKGYRLIDISGNGNHGEIFNCEIVKLETSPNKIVNIPFRRDSLFESLSHKENGFFENKWKHKDTRWNQLRYHNEVTKNDDLLMNDGLSTLKYIEYGKTYNNNILEVNIGI